MSIRDILEESQLKLEDFKDLTRLVTTAERDIASPNKVCQNLLSVILYYKISCKEMTVATRYDDPSGNEEGEGEGNVLLTLAVPAIPTEVAAARVLELAVAFGADADHVGHDGAGDGFLV